MPIIFIAQHAGNHYPIENSTNTQNCYLSLGHNSEDKIMERKSYNNTCGLHCTRWPLHTLQHMTQWSRY